ncbi:MAG: tRNA (adenosine(37)-N6)-threonylcarbamoyltransferase complex ATPase subunit type 1 TsaE [Verrucomicrobiia bacterium]
MAITISHDAEETIALGAAFARGLTPGTVLLLAGDLGVGKTHLAKGIVEGLGYEGVVTSPTFPIIHEYATPQGPVIHADLYRIDSESELLRLGLDQLLADAHVALVEWAQKFPDFFPRSSLTITIEAPDAGTRLIQFPQA